MLPAASHTIDTMAVTPSAPVSQHRTTRGSAPVGGLLASTTGWPCSPKNRGAEVLGMVWRIVTAGSRSRWRAEETCKSPTATGPLYCGSPRLDIVEIHWLRHYSNSSPDRPVLAITAALSAELCAALSANTSAIGMPAGTAKRWLKFRAESLSM